MGSIYRDLWEEKAKKEIDELLKKKIERGWTKEDAERYEFLIEELKKSK